MKQTVYFVLSLFAFDYALPNDTYYKHIVRSKAMFKINMMKAIKITLGCCIAFGIQHFCRYHYFAEHFKHEKRYLNCCVETFCCISACLFHRHYLIYNLSVFCLGTGRLFDNNRHSLSGICIYGRLVPLLQAAFSMKQL